MHKIEKSLHNFLQLIWEIHYFQVKSTFPVTTLPRDNIDVAIANDNIPIAVNEIEDVSNDLSSVPTNNQEPTPAPETDIDDQNSVEYNDGSGRKCIKKVRSENPKRHQTPPTHSHTLIVTHRSHTDSLLDSSR